MNDLDILIPLFIDHPDRIINCSNTIKILQKYNCNNIYVMEYYNEFPKADFLEKNNVNYFTFKTNEPYFNRQECWNKLTQLSKNSFLALYDVDVILSKKDIKQALNMLKNEFDFVYPYNGKFYDVPKSKIENFIHNGIINVNECSLNHPNSCGGCIMFKRESFLAGGMCNPNFKNTGFDDNELQTRFLKLNFKMGRTNSPLFHLQHERTHTSYGVSQYDNHNQIEYYKVSNMSSIELKEYIKTWL